MVTEERSIENKSQVQRTTNYHQCIKIQNTKSKSRGEKRNSRSIRPTVANYNNVQIENPVVPGNKSYSSTTTYGKKICVVGDSHIRQIKRNLFNNSLYEGKAELNGLSRANIKHLDHFIISTLVADQPDIVIIHIGSNDITHNAVEQIDVHIH